MMTGCEKSKAQSKSSEVKYIRFKPPEPATFIAKKYIEL